MSEIVTFELFHSHGDRFRFVAQNPSSVGDFTAPTGAVADGPQVVARVNQGRWIGDCPVDGCGGAELVSFETPVFFCCECRNLASGHAYLPVVVPDPAKRAQVEAYLVARPTPATRNWVDETVKELRDENRDNGIRLP